MRLPRHYAPFIYGILQAAITTGVATLIATTKMQGADFDMVTFWLSAWALAWATMLPVVLVIAPIIQRFVMSLTTQPD